jgi:hypothetical protein
VRGYVPRGMPSRIRRAVGGAILPVLFATAAFGASPVRNATYNGFFVPGGSFRMQISGDGARIATLRFSDPAGPCVPGNKTHTTFHNVAIHGGAFRSRAIKHIAAGPLSITVTGKFTAGKQAKGTIHEQNASGRGPLCPADGTWFATVGSGKPPIKHCGRFMSARNIVVRGQSFVQAGVNCSVARSVLRKGAFTGPGQDVFTSPGWTCTFVLTRHQRPRPNTRYACSRGPGDGIHGLELLFTA